MDRHPEWVLYTVWALWLVGVSAPTIGKVVARSRKQVLGIITRSPYPNRSAMTKEERQAALDRLLLIRTGDDRRPLDRGLLDRVPRRVMNLRTGQVRRPVPPCVSKAA